MTVDDVVEGIFRRLCLRRRHQGVGAHMSFTGLRLALEMTEQEMMEALRVLRLSDDLHVVFTDRDRVMLGTSWRVRCEDGGRR